MKLTDNEKREILKLIKADKPPPTSTALCFDNRREVTSIVLPFQVIERVDVPWKLKPQTDANARESGKGIRAEIRLEQQAMFSSRQSPVQPEYPPEIIVFPGWNFPTKLRHNASLQQI